jgi:flagellar hook-length control protein FliK
VVRVSSDVTVSTSYQAAPPTPARFEPSQASDSFSSLLDSNIPPDPPAPPTPQRYPSGASATADSPAPRDPAPDQPAPSNGTDTGANVQQSDSPATAASNSSAPKTDASSRNDGKASDGKAGAGKTGQTKSADTTAKDSAGSAAAATDATSGAQTNVLALIQNPVAVAIPVTIAPAQAPAVAPAPDGAQKPLAIAAAALAVAAATATNASAGAGPATSATTANTNSATGVTPVTSEKISAQAASVKPAAGASAPATEQTVATDTTNTTDIALAAAISGPQTIGGKSASTKGTPQGQLKAQVAGDGAASPDTTKTVATTEAGLNGAGPQPAAGAKPDAVLTAAGAAKPDISSTTANAADPVSSRDHVSAGTNAPTSSVNTDASLQASTTFLPQAPSTPPVLSAANLTATAATGAMVPLSGLAVEIAASAHSGKTRFDVRLDPADLGRIDVRIDVDRNGQVTSHLRVEKPETLSMLQQDAPQLRQALDDAGLKTGNGGLQFSLRDQSSSGQNQSGGNAQRLVISEDDTVPVAVAGRSYGRVLGSNSGVDIRV